MATRSMTITVKDLRRTMDLAENMVKAVHAALDELKDQEIEVPDWAGVEITLGGHKPAPSSPCFGPEEFEGGKPPAGPAL